METTLDYAETHFSQLLRRVVNGEEILLRAGEVTVAKIVPVNNAPLVSSAQCARPKVGEVTSAPIRWSADSFSPLDDAGLKELRLL
jgi:antitoxin (DNA-binding transcriptional repressor) of toxin-antitoxin stability system